MSIDVTQNGVLFGNKHTARNYGLVLTARPNTGSPKPKLYTQDIPGADGVLDLTEATTGEVKYGNRTITINAKRIMPIEDQEALKSEIMGDLHGRKLRVILDEDPERYYYGRVSVTAPQRKGKQLYINISVDADPYKRELTPHEVVVDLAAELRFFGPQYVSGAYTNPTAQLQNLTEWNYYSDTGNTIDLGGPIETDKEAFCSLAIRMPYASQHGASVAVVVRDTHGNEYTKQLTDYDFSSVYLMIERADMEAAGIDTGDISYVSISLADTGDPAQISLYRVIRHWGFIRFENGAMPVTPELYSSEMNGVWIGTGIDNLAKVDSTWAQYEQVRLDRNRPLLLVRANVDAVVGARATRGWL